MLAPAGSSQASTSQSKSSEGGDTERRRKPVAGSPPSGWSARATSAGASPSMSARRRETVEPCAPASRQSTEAVGLTSPFSIRLSEARLTPLSVESSSSDQRRARRSSRSRSARRRSAASRDGASVSISGKYSQNRERQAGMAVSRASRDELRSVQLRVSPPDDRENRVDHH